MIIYREIIRSKNAPADKYALWLRKGALYYYDGGWKPIRIGEPITDEYPLEEPDCDCKPIKNN